MSAQDVRSHYANEAGPDFSRYEVFSRSEELDHAEGPHACFGVASGSVLTEGYGHDGPGVRLSDGQTESYVSEGYGHGGPDVCLGNGQTETEEVP